MDLEAATIPLVTLTAALSIFVWTRRSVEAGPVPLMSYSASSALGSFAIELTKASGVHPIVAVAGGSRAYAESMLEKDGGDRMVDYGDGVEMTM